MTIPVRSAAIYLRVSADRQAAENQIAEVRQLATARGYKPVVYEEVESAAKARHVLDRMLADVREGRRDTNGPVRPLLVAIFGWVAEQERTRLIDRTKAGVERARRQGKRLGRPPASPVLLHAARDLVASGVAVADAARQKGVARSTLQRFMQAHAPVL